MIPHAHARPPLKDDCPAATVPSAQKKARDPSRRGSSVHGKSTVFLRKPMNKWAVRHFTMHHRRQKPFPIRPVGLSRRFSRKTDEQWAVQRLTMHHRRQKARLMRSIGLNRHFIHTSRPSWGRRVGDSHAIRFASYRLRFALCMCGTRDLGGFFGGLCLVPAGCSDEGYLSNAGLYGGRCGCHPTVGAAARLPIADSFSPSGDQDARRQRQRLRARPKNMRW